MLGKGYGLSFTSDMQGMIYCLFVYLSIFVFIIEEDDFLPESLSVTISWWFVACVLVLQISCIPLSIMHFRCAKGLFLR